MLKRQRQHRRLHKGRSTRDSLGRFRKKDPFDCGRPGCQLCHFEKIHGVKSPSERKADEAFANEVEHLND